MWHEFIQQVITPKLSMKKFPEQVTWLAHPIQHHN